jgi:hypothetical protein
MRWFSDADVRIERISQTRLMRMRNPPFKDAASHHPYYDRI